MLNYINSSINSSPESMKLLANRLKVLSEPKRLLILEMIIQGLQCNCELGDALQMAPNLISHRLGKLRKAGLVNAERDPLDSRWVYYSINHIAWDELNANFGAFFDPHRIRPRHLTCGPSANTCASDNQSTCSPEKPNHE
jgi:ArsR family transcriptional regulator